MERLTERIGNNQILLNHPDGKFDNMDTAISRLAAYEDTGLTPKEIDLLKETYFKACDEIKSLIAERDAAVGDMNIIVDKTRRRISSCEYCHRFYDYLCPDCFECDKWQWRGVQGKEDKA